MARSWLRLFAGATLSLSVAGHALADEGKITQRFIKKKRMSMLSPLLPHLLRWRVRLKLEHQPIYLFLPTRNGWIMR